MKVRWILFVVLLVLLLSTAGCLKESRFAVTGMVIAPASVTSGQAVLNVSTSIENTFGFGAGGVRLQLQAYDTETGLLVHESTHEVGAIGRGETRVVTPQIALPHRGSYRIVAMVFENQKHRATGEITVHSLERLPADSAKTDVGVTDMDFLVRGVDNGRAIIEAAVYFTNRGVSASPDLSVEVKAREANARLIADRQWTTVEGIRPDGTVIRNVTLSVPDQYNYEVEVVLWRGDVIVERGTGRVALAPSTQISKDEQFVTTRIETSRFVTSETVPQPGATRPIATPGFGGPIAILAIAASLGYWRFKNHDR